MKKLLVLYLLFSCLIFGVNKEKLISAQKEALKDYKKSASLAKNTLEKAGIEELLENGIPNNFSKEQYVSLMNDYGFYEMECKNYDRAIEILNLVLEKDYKRAVAHYNLGECYLYKASQNIEDKDLNISLAKSSFSNYIKLLKKDAKIPQKVKDILGKDLELLLSLKKYDIDAKLVKELNDKLVKLYENESFLISFMIPTSDKSKKIVLVEGLYPCNGLYIYDKGSLMSLETGLTKLLYFIQGKYLVFHSSIMNYGLQRDKYYTLDLNNAKIKLLYFGLSDGESGGFGRGQEIGISDYALDNIKLEQEGSVLKLKIVEEGENLTKRNLEKVYKFDEKGINEIR